MTARFVSGPCQRQERLVGAASTLGAVATSVSRRGGIGSAAVTTVVGFVLVVVASADWVTDGAGTGGIAGTVVLVAGTVVAGPVYSDPA